MSSEYELLDADFCRRFGAKPFEVSPEFLDLDTDFIKELSESLQAGFDPSRPIILAQGPKEIQGLVVDGKHRLLCTYLLEKKGIKIKPKPQIAFEEIASIEEYKARVAHYVLKSRSKDNKLAKKIIEANINDIIEAKASQYGEKLPEYIADLGFGSATIVNKLFKQAKNRSAGGVSKHKRQKPARLNTSLNQERWHFGSDESTKIEVDQIANYAKSCPTCNSPLLIITDTKGTVLEVKHSPKQAV